MVKGKFSQKGVNYRGQMQMLDCEHFSLSERLLHGKKYRSDRFYNKNFIIHYLHLLLYVLYGYLYVKKYICEQRKLHSLWDSTVQKSSTVLHLLKLVFQTDRPVPPGQTGSTFFLSKLSDKMRQQARDRLFKVTKDDIVDVTQR